MPSTPPPPTLPPLPTPVARPKVVTGLGCASCGGSLEVQEGWTTVRCRYCATPLAVVGERGVVRVMVLDRVDRARASAAVRAWLTTGIRKEPALKREAVVDEAFLAWFPFVRVRLDVVGWILGVKKTRTKRGDKWVTTEEAVEREVEQAVDRTAAAADMHELGVHRVDLAGDEVVPLDEAVLRARGMLFRPLKAPAEVAEAVAQTAMDAARQGHGLDRVTFSWLASLRREVTVVYYPLWVFRYRFRDSVYQVLLDAEDGTLACGKAPGNHLYRAASLVGAAAGACFLGTTALQYPGLILSSDEPLGVVVVLGLAIAGMVVWGYRQFRHGGLVEEGSGVADERRPASLAATVKRLTERVQ